MKDEINKIEADIIAWRNTLDLAGVWLFLATLGCWSVPTGWLRFVALVTAIFLFFWRLSGVREDSRPFDKRIGELELRIEVDFGDSDQGKSLQHELIQMRKSHLSLASFKKSGFVYFICTMFWFISFVNSHKI